jgi:hypothetical protein
VMHGARCVWIEFDDDPMHQTRFDSKIHIRLMPLRARCRGSGIRRVDCRRWGSTGSGLQGRSSRLDYAGATPGVDSGDELA